MRSMRIGVLTTSYPRAPGDYAGLFVHGFARSLVARGHEVEVLAPEPDLPTSLPETLDGVRLRWVPYGRPRQLQRTFYRAGVPENLRRDPWAWPGLLTYPAALFAAAVRASESWDAIVSHWCLPNALVAGLIARGRPHLAILHSADVHALTRLPGGALLARQVVRSATSLLFVTTQLRDRFVDRLARDAHEPPRTSALAPDRESRQPTGNTAYGDTVDGRPIHVCPMGVDAPSIGASREALRRTHGFRHFTVMTLGRIVPIKGIADAIRAVATGSGIELVVAGEGPDAPDLVRLARELRAPVRFIGPVADPTKTELLTAADIFVAPSRTRPGGRSEGAPVAILEAMAAGLPVVATSVGGIPSLVRDEVNGLLVPEGTPRALRLAIERLEQDDALRARLGHAARTFAQRFTWAHLAAHYEALLRGESAAFPAVE